jgi:hypothetical protein|tara:strand:- start:10895 stop:11077 length:183 start_codon:yes stop_codon:yes gene_type:complete
MSRYSQEKVEEQSFTAKEIGFLISMIEEMAISGKVLELAFMTKVKLQAKLNEIANKQTEF